MADLSSIGAVPDVAAGAGAAQLGLVLQVAIASKAREIQTAEGQDALNLVQSAAATQSSPPSVDPTKGHLVDTYA